MTLRYLTPAEVAEILGVPTRRVNDMISSGEIEVRTLGERTHRVSPAELARFLGVPLSEVILYTDPDHALDFRCH